MTSSAAPRPLSALTDALRRIDGKGYRAYRDLAGVYAYDEGPAAGMALHIEHVQGDPFATPSRIRLCVPQSVHGLGDRYLSTEPRRLATADFVLRVFGAAADRLSLSGAGSSGRIDVTGGAQAVLARSGAYFNDDDELELRFRVGLPAKGRRIAAGDAERLLVERLAEAAATTKVDALDTDALLQTCNVVEDHRAIQFQLRTRGLVAFIADGAILPRHAGNDDGPLEGAVPTAAPEALRVKFETSHHGELTGLGIKDGVTLIAGGGFHGKSTVLQALSSGIYPHVPGDGREFVVTRPDAVKVRSEDGRAITGVDLSTFIRDLPRSVDVTNFSTQDASGSTSLAAHIAESVDLGATALLIDEDTAAANLLVRDARMDALIQKEPITPLIDRVRSLTAEGLSFVLVCGASGEYLDVADQVLVMEDYAVLDRTTDAAEIAKALPRTPREVNEMPGWRALRNPTPESFNARRGKKDRVKNFGRFTLQFGDDVVDLDGLEQLVCPAQTRAIGAYLKALGNRADGKTAMRTLVVKACAELRRDGMYALDASPELAQVRPFELGAAVNRLRSLKLGERK